MKCEKHDKPMNLMQRDRGKTFYSCDECDKENREALDKLVSELPELEGLNYAIVRQRQDLEFLKEMKKCWDKCNSGFDIMSFEHLGKMIDDWIDELEEQPTNPVQQDKVP